MDKIKNGLNNTNNNTMNQKDILKLAGVKNEKELYAKFKTHEEFLAKYGAQIQKAEGGLESFLKPIGGVSGGIDSIGKVIGGIQQLGAEKKKRKSLEQWADVSDVVRQAASMPQDIPEREYATPWDNITDGSAFANIYGTNVNPLAKNGTELKKAFNGEWLKNTEFGKFTNTGGMDKLSSLLTTVGGENAGGTIGGELGSTAGKLIGGPVGGAIGKIGGQVIGGLIDRNPHKIKEAQNEINKNIQATGFGQGVQQQYSSFMRTGGNIRNNETSELDRYDDGGGIKALWGGKIKPESFNPYSDDDGITRMPYGNSHDETDGKGRSGIGMSVDGSNSPDVEVERNEPMMSKDDSVIVFGDQTLSKELASVIGTPQYAGKKYKYIMKNDIIPEENKQMKLLNKGKTLAETADHTSFGKLQSSTARAIDIGANMKLKQLDNDKNKLADGQQFTNNFAEVYDIDAGEFSRGKIEKVKKAAKGITLKPLSDYGVKNNTPERIKQIQQELVDKGYGISVDGVWGMKTQQALDSSINENLTPIQPKGLSQLPIQNLNTKKLDVMMRSLDQKEQDNKFPWMQVINSIVPIPLPSDADSINPSQFSGEFMGLSREQKPVYAQTMQPDLAIPYNISYQDALNENQADFRSTQRMVGNNPAALAILNAQKYGANQKVLGEQFRQNQQEQNRVFEKNRNIVNQTKLQNLNILSQQQDKQSTAESKTFNDRVNAMQSISNKTLQHDYYNKLLQVGENTSRFRYDENGRLVNMNGLAQFNTEGNNQPSSGITTNNQGETLLPIYDKYQNITGYKVKEIQKAKTTSKKGRNGLIVRELKSF